MADTVDHFVPKSRCRAPDVPPAEPSARLFHLRLSRKGQWAIDVCGLNEGKRRRARERAWQNLGGDLKEWARARDEGRPDDMRHYVWCMRDQPFADVCYAALHKAVSVNADANLVDADPHVRALLRDEELCALLLQ
ncbi:hypothetical protein [Streptomyces sp. NPDC059828]|uniref:hypothetical protein n=1 Tax=Streptomyces sp. NPDC059828 TaxID=3346965 RepID=UPI003652EB44